jgi:uncharacterized protein
MDTADPVLPQVWRWTTNKAVTTTKNRAWFSRNYRVVDVSAQKCGWDITSYGPARECYKWLLCPSQDNPTGKPTVETFPLNTSGPSLGTEIERVCLDNELVIPTWSPIHLRTKLKELYWKTDKPAVKAADFWEDTLRYLYLPRLKDRGVLAQAIVKGAGTRDFFGTAYGQIDEKFEGFKFGDSNVQLDDTLLLIEPITAPPTSIL